MVLVYSMFLNRFSHLISSSTGLFLITMRRLYRDRTRRHRTRTKRAKRNPITRVTTSRIIRLDKVIVMDIRRPLTRRVRKVLFVLNIIRRDLPRKRIAGHLQGDRRGHVLTNFAAKRGVFRDVPLALFLFFNNGAHGSRVSTTRNRINRILGDDLRIFLCFFNRNQSTHAGDSRRVRNRLYNTIPRFRNGNQLSTNNFRRILRFFILLTTKSLKRAIRFRYDTTHSLTGSLNKGLRNPTIGVRVLWVRSVILRLG